MIIALLSQEKNLGILTLTNFLIEKLGKSNTSVCGWNYLISDVTPILEKIKESSKTGNVVIKYIYPKIKFTNQDLVYPEEIKEISDLIFKVPTYREELTTPVPLTFYKGAENFMSSRIKEFYV